MLYNYVTNTDEQVVLDAKFLAFYKGVPVIKLPIGKEAFSFGIIFLGNDVGSRSDAINTVRHEYGHSVQFAKMGPFRYLQSVAIPSIMGNLLDRADLLPCYYYDQPWEYQADVYGGVNRGNYASWADRTGKVYFSVVDALY